MKNYIGTVALRNIVDLSFPTLVVLVGLSLKVDELSRLTIFEISKKKVSNFFPYFHAFTHRINPLVDIYYQDILIYMPKTISNSLYMSSDWNEPEGLS